MCVYIYSHFSLKANMTRHLIWFVEVHAALQRRGESGIVSFLPSAHACPVYSWELQGDCCHRQHPLKICWNYCISEHSLAEHLTNHMWAQQWAEQFCQRLPGRKISQCWQLCGNKEGSYLLLCPPKNCNNEAAKHQTLWVFSFCFSLGCWFFLCMWVFVCVHVCVCCCFFFLSWFIF